MGNFPGKFSFLTTKSKPDCSLNIAIAKFSNQMGKSIANRVNLSPVANWRAASATPDRVTHPIINHDLGCLTLVTSQNVY